MEFDADIQRDLAEALALLLFVWLVAGGAVLNRMMLGRLG